MKKYAYTHTGRMQREKGGTYLGQRGVLHELNRKKKKSINTELDIKKAQLIKCLPCKYEDLSLTSSTCLMW